MPDEWTREREIDEVCRVIEEVGADFIITDLCHRKTINTPGTLIAYHREVRMRSGRFVLSFEDPRMMGFASDAAVIPYPCEVDVVERSLDGCRVLSGMSYFVLRPEFCHAPSSPREIRASADRVVVCIGGADPAGLTARLARVLAGTGLSVRFVLGFGAGRETIAEVEAVCTASPECLQLIVASNDLAGHLRWADLAVIGEGLIKYEAAATGTPALMMSVFDHDSGPHLNFIDLGSVRYLGGAGDVTDANVIREVHGLLRDGRTRQRLATIGQSLLDGNGVERIIRDSALPLMAMGTL